MGRQQQLGSYDEALGPPDGRYFGDGYKRVQRQVSNVSVEHSPGGTTGYSAIAALDYPTDWSTKGSADLVPHLSSIDTIVLATSICELAVVEARALLPEDAARMWVRRVTVRAGSKPQTDLEHVPVYATVVDAVEDRGNGKQEVETTFRFNVGELGGSLTMCHPLRSWSGSPPKPETLSLGAVYGGSGRHRYLDGFKDQTLSAWDVVIDAASTRITGRHRVEMTAPSGTGYCGTESAYPESMSMIHAVVGGAQLAQILLYQMDSIDRTNSNTLWMRDLELIAQGPVRPCGAVFDGSVEIRRTRLLDRSQQRWRHAEAVMKEFNGVTAVCRLRHELPREGIAA